MCSDFTFYPVTSNLKPFYLIGSFSPRTLVPEAAVPTAAPRWCCHFSTEPPTFNSSPEHCHSKSASTNYPEEGKQVWLFLQILSLAVSVPLRVARLSCRVAIWVTLSAFTLSTIYNYPKEQPDWKSDLWVVFLLSI